MPVTITCDLIRQTERAVMIRCDEQEMWIPKSQLIGMVPAVQAIDCSLTLTDWIAAQKGLTLGEERYVAEQVGLGDSLWLVKDMKATPVRKICMCENGRDANMIAAALCMTEGKV